MRAAATAGQIPTWLPIALLVLGGSLLLLLYPQSEDDVDGGGGAGNPAAEGTNPRNSGLEGAEFVGPDTAAQGTPRESGPLAPPDRVYVSSGATEGTIRGRVLLQKGLEWPDAVTLELRLQGEKRVIQVRGVRPEDPNFEFSPQRFGDYRLSVHADGGKDYAVLLTLSERSPDLYQQLALEPDAKVLGIVRDTSGKAAAGVQITVLPWTDPPRGGIPTLGRSDAEGHFTIGGLGPGDYEVYAGNLQYPLSKPTRILISPSAREAWVELEVAPLGSATITLLDEAGGNNLEVVRVQATLMAKAGERGYSISVAADASGVARFPGLPTGDYAFQAYGGVFRRTSRNVTVLPGNDATLAIPLLPFRKPEDGR